MDIYRLAKKSGVALKTLRKLEKLNVLKIDKANEDVSKLAFHMRTNMRFTMSQLLLLIDNPDLLADLESESERYAKRARAQIAEIGDLKASSAPDDVTAEIRQAGKGDDDATLVIVEWLKSVLPIEPVNYHWIAARLLYPLSPFLREQATDMLTLAMMGVRKMPEFAGYWRSETVGKKQTIKYFQKQVDGWDL